MADQGSIGYSLETQRTRDRADPVTWDERAMEMPGTVATHNASTPDSAAISITGDIDIRIKVQCADWTPGTSTVMFLVNKMPGASDRSYRLGLASSGVLRWEWSTDGTVGTLVSKDSTVAPSVTDGDTLWVRVTHDVDNGAAGNDVKFYTSLDGKTWTQLGSTVTTASTTSIFDSVGAMTIGDSAVGVAHKIHYIEFRNGIDGPVVAKFDPSLDWKTGSSFTASTGEVWTINGTASIVFQGNQLGTTEDVGIKSATIAADGDAVIVGQKLAQRVSNSYTVSGLTKVAGVNTSGITVRVFRRDNGLLLGETVSGAGGAWSFTIIGYNGEVTCVAYDLPTGTQYNAQIYDQVTPA